MEYIVKGFQFGFSLKYKGPLENRQSKNLLSTYQHSDKLWASLMKEVCLGCILGPFLVQPLDPLICSLVGMVKKRDSDEMHRITHLSHSRGRSINVYIDPEDTQKHYQSFEAVVELVEQVGPGAFMAKEDFKSAFRNVPICFQDRKLLGIKVKSQFFIDNCLLF